MSWVMVPCPEEHVDAVKGALMRLTLGSAGWDDETAAALVTTLEDHERSVVVAVAEASMADGHLSYRDASRRLGLEEGEILNLATALNDRCARASIPPLLFTDSQAVSGGDAEPTAVPVLIINRPVAAKLLALLRAPYETEGG